MGRTVRSRSKNFGKPEGILQVKGFSDDKKVEVVASVKEEFLSGVVYSLGKRKRWETATDLRSAAQQDRHCDETVVVVERNHRPASNPQPPDCISVSRGYEKFVESNKKLGSRVEDLLKNVKPDHSDVACEVSYPVSKSSWAGNAVCGIPKRNRSKKASYARKKLQVEKYDWDIDDEEEVYETNDPSVLQKSRLNNFVETNFDIGGYIGDMIENADDSNTCVKPTIDLKLKRRKTKSRKSLETPCNANQKRHNDSHIIIGDDEIFQKWRKSTRKMQSKSQKAPELVSDVAALPLLIETSKWSNILVSVNKEEIKPTFLKQQFQENYREAQSLPRTFQIQLKESSPGFSESLSCSLVIKLENPSCSQGDIEKVYVNIVTDTQIYLDMAVDLQFALANSIERLVKDNHPLRVRDLVTCSSEAVAKIVPSIKGYKGQFNHELRQPEYSLSILGPVLGWTTTCFVTVEAEKDARKDITNKALAVTSELAKDSKNGSVYQKAFPDSCGICFEDFKQNGTEQLQCTAMLDCCHWFCNECWLRHIICQSPEAKNQLTCPEYQCTTPVDLVTIMSLIPSCYAKYTRHVVGRELETSPVWRWCPSDRCSLAVKAVPHISSEKIQPGPVPVICACGSVWCFRCQDRAHWPASCQQAKEFYKEHSRFYLPDKNLITSVDVKKCPKCMYPIEKYMGCNFMRCIRCQTGFCWNCLQLFHNCECRRIGFPHTQIRGRIRVELPLEGILFPEKDPFVYIYQKNFKATTRRFLKNSFTKLQKLQYNLSNIQAAMRNLLDEPRRCKKSAKAKVFVQFLAENEVPAKLKAIYNVKFQAQLMLEGTAIFIDCHGKNLAKQNNLHHSLMRLQFIVDRLEVMLSDYSKLMQNGLLQKLANFATEAIKTIAIIGRQIGTNSK